MERVIIKELDRALRQARQRTLAYTDEELKEIQNMLSSAGYAISLEIYSRQVEAMETTTPELV